MAIKLMDIREAFLAYMRDKVHVTISAIKPEEGVEVNPGENFTFQITVNNEPNVPGDGDEEHFNLTNVRYRVFVGDNAKARLFVPPASEGTATDNDGKALTPGTLVGDMLLRPIKPGNDKAFDLEIGDTDTLRLTGRAGSAGSGGTTDIFVLVHADLPLNHIIPKAVPTPRLSKSLVISG